MELRCSNKDCNHFQDGLDEEEIEAREYEICYICDEGEMLDACTENQNRNDEVL